MIRRAYFALALLALLPTVIFSAQQPPQPPPKKNTQPPPTFEPFKAEKSVEIGMFYLKKKNYDAAIERFLDAVRYKPGFARPHYLLGRAYEGKRDYEDAIIHYNAYLEILPQADNAKQVRQRIAQLTRKVERAKARRKKS
ncbi:MAG TPA: tetratricopeptide repeat protein [Candidatus Acidoferrales bacterium]|jgi:tetratricopeptide (TPR) repeat protein|nr:tetratricopeptide repeat protein [Candidatus Acidoferrales bacterium]